MNLKKNKINIDIIVPRVVVHKLDPHTGIPFLPHMAGYLAGTIKNLGYDLNVIDAFGEDSSESSADGDFLLLGISENKIISMIKKETKICFIYCKVIEDLYAVEKLMLEIKKRRPDIKICLFENIQTTNSFSLKKIIEYLFKKGCDFVIFGEPENKIDEVIISLIEKREPNVDGVAYFYKNKLVVKNNENFNKELDNLPFPLWEKFNLEGYWKIGFAHAPVKNNTKFLPLLTSRGCPFRCKFCVSPTLNPKWRKRSAVNVVNEMEYFYKKMGVTDFHVSDLDPTVDEKRIIEICNLLIEKKLPIEWKLSQGTKVETIKNLSTLKLLKDSKLTFFAFSPETGSKDLMKKLNKPFDYEHALNVTSNLNKLGIFSQACFILGTPPETKRDRAQTLTYIKKLVKAGIDEIALYIYSPIPGSYFADQVEGFKHYSELSRSPTWRKDYKEVNFFRIKAYLTFFLYKLIFQPKKVLLEIFRLLNMEFKTKMEMSLFKYIKLRIIKFKSS